jgi:hypothetical protein
VTDSEEEYWAPRRNDREHVLRQAAPPQAK